MYIFFTFSHNTKGKEDFMETVPVMISTKDLAYLSDIFEWNFTAAKVANHYLKEVQTEKINEFIRKVFEFHKDTCEKCIQMLGGNYES